MNAPRDIHHRYDDPLDLVWLACARDIGIRVLRSHEVYASYDGQGTLTLSEPSSFDADDSLAQLIFHELCHGLVAGPRRARLVDWGMENVDTRDLVVEHACHRLQARLADDYGLRGLFAVTTDHRPYWDALPLDPLGPSDDPALPMAREAYGRAKRGPWAKALASALSRTQGIAAIARELDSPASSLWNDTRALHASGFPMAVGSATCGACAWASGQAPMRTCRQSKTADHPRGKRVSALAAACVRFEPQLDESACAPCGACCREAFDRVEVSARDLVQKRHPDLVVEDGFGKHLPRPGGRCVALTGDGDASAYRCDIYAERPSACRSFAIGSDACLTARKRVGLSP